MGLFSTTTPFDEPLDKATNEMNTETDWGLIVTICDKIKATSKGPHEFANAILPKMNHRVPHVAMQALTVLDSCVNNCGKEFQKEIASQGFTDCLREILMNYKNKKVTKKLRFLIRKWAEDFKEDQELSHFVSFYYQLRGDGYDFPEEDETEPKKVVPINTNPDSVSSQQEADDIAKAIEASLKEEQQKKGYSSSQAATLTSSLYPSMLGGSTPTGMSYSGASYTSAGTPAPKKKVKALYDFEAAEDNELTFKAGDFLFIIDDSDANWWKGEGSNGNGLFPSNFVTSDLSANVESEVTTSTAAVEEEEERETVVKFNDDPETKEFDKDQPVLAVDEDLIDRTLAAVQSTDPETVATDPPELLRDEESCNQMGKLIDSKLETLDRRHLELSMLNEKILESLQLYDTLMKQMPVYKPPTQFMPGQGQMPPAGAMYGQPPPQQIMQGYPQGTYPPGNPYMPQQGVQGMNPGAPGPSAAPVPMPQMQGQMPPTQAAYNPMYQPNSAYPPTNGNITTIDQQAAMQQTSTTAYGTQNYSAVPSSSGPVQQPNGGYNAPMMPPYHDQASPFPSGYASGGSPQHFPTTSQVPTQPLM